MQVPLPSHELRVAIDAARAGAQKALEYYETGVEAVLKEDKSVVTKADYAVEQVIKDRVLSDFPQADFLAEESGGSIEGDVFWIIDPIDGTRSFSRNIPNWNILISFCRNKELCFGVSYFPIMDILVMAEKGKGAFINNKQVHVSNVNTLQSAFIGTGSPRNFKDKQILTELVDSTSCLRMLESAFTDMLIAKGSVDSMIDPAGKTWDLAAYKVIIEEAGGKVTRLDGSEWKIDDNIGAILSNGILHEEVLAIVKKYY